MKWLEISVETTHEAAEVVAEILHELGTAGVLIEDPELVNTYITSGAWDYTDIPLAEQTDVVEVKAWLPEDEELPNKIEQLQLRLTEIGAFLDKGKGLISTSEIQDEDWANNWKKYFHPEKIGAKIVVKPSWEEYLPQGEDIIIDLDPGMAFGTGTHATTSMCIKYLEELVKPGDTVFDVGTGSGILAIAASKLGAEDLQAADYDPVAVKVAVENIEKNHEADKIKVFQSDLLAGFQGQADLIIANIIADIIIRMMPTVKAKLKEGGALLTSGIIEDRIDDVIEAAAAAGLKVEMRKELKGWAAIVFKVK